MANPGYTGAGGLMGPTMSSTLQCHLASASVHGRKPLPPWVQAREQLTGACVLPR